MLRIIRSVNELDFRKLADVYVQSCLEQGEESYPNEPPFQQLLLGEQAFYGDMMCFLKEPNAYCAVWEHNGRYLSALRIEPYQDGYLLEGLETAPSHRRMGYARQLISSVLAHFSGTESKKIYVHIRKNNKASLLLHLACGFEKILETAVFVDGSVSQNAYTMLKQI